MGDSGLSGDITGAVAVVISVITAIIALVNHKRIRSNCCGKQMTASVDIENTTPPNSVRLSNPPAPSPSQTDA